MARVVGRSIGKFSPTKQGESAMLMFMVLSATLGLGLGGLIRTFVNHWSSYVIAVVLGPVFGVLLAMGVSLLEPGDKDRVLEMGHWL
jgi:hypothetical protein